jgi:hypothetical protein
MIRFIFVCMAVVAFSFMTLAGQSVIDGINDARENLLARNAVSSPQVETLANDEITFEEIYANAPVQDLTSPEALNEISTAAGGNEFSQGFTDVAPAALRDQSQNVVPVEASPTAAE